MNVHSSTACPAAHENDFVPWTKLAKHGDKFVYFTGDLSALCGDEKKPFHTDARRIRNAAQDAYEAGRVTLTRRRVKYPGVFEYIAVRTIEKRPRISHFLREWPTKK